MASGPDARPRALEAAEALLRQGAGAAVVTADAAGAAVCSDGAGEWVPAPRVAEVRNPIGAGDVLLSALAGALEQGASLVDAVRAGVAAASASVEHPTGGMLDPERARVLAAAMARANEAGIEEAFGVPRRSRGDKVFVLGPHTVLDLAKVCLIRGG